MKALIDGDVIAYQAGFASDTKTYTVQHPMTGDCIEDTSKKVLNKYCDDNKIPRENIVSIVTPEPVSHCLHSVKIMIERIRTDIDADEVLICLSGKGNFRDALYADYKANRDPSHRPHWYQEIRDYMFANFPCIISEGEEADDVLGKLQYDDYIKAKEHELDCDTCVCTIDKDLNMIPSWHYNWNKEEMYFVDRDNADLFFYEQLLTGDSADNIPGIKGIGPVKAKKILKNKFTNADRWEAVQDQYDKAGITNEDLVRNGMLLWIKRTEEDDWSTL